MSEHANVLHFLSRFIDTNANVAPQKKSAVQQRFTPTH